MFKFQSCLLKTFPLPFAKWCTKSPCFSFRHYINFSKGFLMCIILAFKVCSQHLSFKISLGVINLYHVVDIVIKFVHKHANPIELHCGQEVNDTFIKPLLAINHIPYSYHSCSIFSLISIEEPCDKYWVVNILQRTSQCFKRSWPWTSQFTFLLNQTLALTHNNKVAPFIWSTSLYSPSCNSSKVSLKRMWHPCTWYYFFPLKFKGFNHVLVDSPLHLVVHEGFPIRTYSQIPCKH